jgi:hypothetical protein
VLFALICFRWSRLLYVRLWYLLVGVFGMFGCVFCCIDMCLTVAFAICSGLVFVVLCVLYVCVLMLCLFIIASVVFVGVVV